jgi:hypothetical protein
LVQGSGFRVQNSVVRRIAVSHLRSLTSSPREREREREREEGIKSAFGNRKS